jgi:hypothetical protein
MKDRLSGGGFALEDADSTVAPPPALAARLKEEQRRTALVRRV